MLQHGDPAGTVWRPGEADVSIRPGWFWHAAESAKVKRVDDLMELYFDSVGRNANLLLNVPPNRAGLLDDADVSRLTEFDGALSARFGADGARDAHVTASSEAAGGVPRSVVVEDPDTWWSPDRSDPHPSLTLAFRAPVRFDVLDLREAIQHGQRVASYAVDALANGAWQTISTGTTIGHRKLDRVPVTTTDRVRIRIVSSDGQPMIARAAFWSEQS